MIKFEKVSYEQFKKDCEKISLWSEKEIKDAYDGIVLPKRATKGSAGYDFVTPFAFNLCGENDVFLIPTGIRVLMRSGVCLLLYPRSGLGFKTGMRLGNSTGVIDYDYSYSDNEGHIMAKFVRGFKDIEVKQFERVMQGVFTPYFITDDDDVTEERNGGFGSTGK